jgi:hypothetical protein
MKSNLLFSSLLFFLIGCSQMERSEKEIIRKRNELIEPIIRLQKESFFTNTPSEPKKRPLYPWEEGASEGLFKITKEYFSCRGSVVNDAYEDCGGALSHGLPFRDGKEYIYPILIQLLGYIQEKTGHKTVITCGHRCPKHNTYADPSKINQTSKHQIGAEVDFYVEGFEETPLEIVRLLMQYYYDINDPEYFPFSRCKHNPRKLHHPGWYNKEIIIRVQEKEEGRDFDNRHPYPYLTIEVRYDRDADQMVEYNWQIASNGYLRY